MKKTLLVIFSVLMLIVVLAVSSSAYTVDNETSLPIPTQAPEIYYISNDARDDGDRVFANYINSEEIINMQREISALGEKAYLKKYGFNINTEEDSYDYA